uniref:Uncharacterized protein n=1 Tax=Anguilla anguilla TaxID=7936 RepID=A0A0E9WHH5_ANGAN
MCLGCPLVFESPKRILKPSVNRAIDWLKFPRLKLAADYFFFCPLLCTYALLHFF